MCRELSVGTHGAIQIIGVDVSNLAIDVKTVNGGVDVVRSNLQGVGVDVANLAIDVKTVGGDVDAVGSNLQVVGADLKIARGEVAAVAQGVTYLVSKQEGM